MKVFVENIGFSEIDVMVDFVGLDCELVELFELLGTEKASFLVEGCSCPPLGESLVGEVVVSQLNAEQCSNVINVVVKTSKFGSFVSWLLLHPFVILFFFLFLALLVYALSLWLFG